MSDEILTVMPFNLQPGDYVLFPPSTRERSWLVLSRSEVIDDPAELVLAQVRAREFSLDRW